MKDYEYKKRVGVIGVDAGLCWLGDPCYVLHTNAPPVDIGKNWEDFCDILEKKGQHDKGYAQLDYDGPNGTTNGPGLGVVVSTGWGDGEYPVYVTFSKDGRVSKVMVDFEASADDEEE